MPVYEPKGVEYAIISGHVTVMLEDGSQIPAYWSHPNIGGVFPSLALIHDWWGIRPVERRLAQTLAQSGYYVIVPDLFNGKTANSATDAIQLVEALGTRGYAGVHAALDAMENHQRSNHQVAAIGLGMGGSLAYEAAIKRDDLEAAISFYGFPQRYLEELKHARASIMAVYGSGEPYTKANVLKKLAEALRNSPLEHEFHILSGESRDFFDENGDGASQAWALMRAFLDKHLLRSGTARPRT